MTDYVNPDDWFEHLAAELDRYADVPEDVLWDLVTEHGCCTQLYLSDDEPNWTGDAATDRELAALICAGCPVRGECLELELRTAGSAGLGVWGALNDEDRRALYPAWLARRTRRGEGGSSCR